MSEIHEYPYRPKPLKMIGSGLLFAAGGLFMAHQALTNDRGLIIEHLIRLSPLGATIFFWCCTVFCGWLAVLGIIGFFAGVTSKRMLQLSPTELTLPARGFGNKTVVIPFAEIKSVTIHVIEKQRFLVIQHHHGRNSIEQSLLPNQGAFDEIYQALVAHTTSTA